MICILPGLSFGQDGDASSGFLEENLLEVTLGLTVFVAIVAIMAMYSLLVALKAVLRLKQREMGIEEEEGDFIAVKAGEEGIGFWRRFWNRVNDSVPVAREAEVATDHEYDGIRELDNRLPPWWLYGFYISIVFAVIYMFRFTFLDMPTQDEEFQTQLAEGKEQVKVFLASLDNLIDENSITLATASADLSAGMTIYEQNCAVCHASDGGGGVPRAPQTPVSTPFAVCAYRVAFVAKAALTPLAVVALGVACLP